MGSKVKFTEEETEFIRQNYGNIPMSKIIEHIGRNKNTVKNYVIELGLFKKRVEIRDIDVTYGRLTVKSEPFTIISSNGDSRNYLLCRCLCGKLISARTDGVRSLDTTSCGCFNKEQSSIAAKRKRIYSKERLEHPLYKIWDNMRIRCRKSYKLDESEEIACIGEWSDYNTFYDWAILKWSATTLLAKIDKTKDYCPENCIFIQKPYKKVRLKINVFEKYGTKYASQSEIVKDKTRKTCLAKYGVPSTSLVPEFIDKKKKTIIERYGHEYVTLVPEIRQKMKETSIANGYTHIYDGKTTSEKAAELGMERRQFQYYIHKVGYELACSVTPSRTCIEIIMSELLDKIGLKYLREKTIKNRRADFLIEEKKLVIECDGLWWHSDKMVADINYHFHKRNLYKEYGCESFFFREDEIEKNLIVIEHLVKDYCKEKTLVAEYTLIDGNTSNFIDTHTLKKKEPNNRYIHTLAIHIDGQIVGACEYEIFDNEVHISRFAQDGNCSNLLEIFISHLKCYGTVLISRDNRYEKFLMMSEPYRTEIDFNWCRDDKQFPKSNFSEDEVDEKRLAKIWNCGTDYFRFN